MGEVRIDGQSSFAGGLEMVKRPSESQLAYTRNCELRGGYAETRRAVRNAFNGGVLSNDSGITFEGISFPFEFRANVWSDPSGGAFVRLRGWPEWRPIFAVGQNVYVLTGADSADSVPVAPGALTGDMDVSFVQADNKVVMFRADRTPLIWRGGAAGFVEMTPPGGRSIPVMDNGIYFGGRIIGWHGDSLFVSDIFDPESYDIVNAQFSVGAGDGEEITCVCAFSHSNILIFKNTSTHIASGIVGATSSATLENFSIEVLDSHIGAVGRHAFAACGSGVAFWSHRGAEYVYRNQYGQIQMSPSPESESIAPLVSRVNKSADAGICGIEFDSYVFFAVPMDGAAHNNCLLVFDQTLSGGSQYGLRGGWVGVWDSSVQNILSPKRFFVSGSTLYFICQDGHVRTFVGWSATDTDAPMIDCPEYSATADYIKGSVVFSLDGDAVRYHRALRAIPDYTVDEGTGDVEEVYPPLTDSRYWAQIDRDEAFAIRTELLTRLFDHGSEMTTKRYQTTTIHFESSMAKVDVAIEEPGTGPVHDVFSNVEYDPDAYKTVRPIYDNTNRDDDFNDPLRNDYLVVLRENTDLMLGPGGVTLDALTAHTLRFVPMLSSGTGFRARITNKRGRLRLRSIVVPAEQQQLSWRAV